MFIITDVHDTQNYIGEYGIVRISEADPNSAGIRHCVHTVDGRVIETRMTAQEIMASRVMITAQSTQLAQSTQGAH
jgi:hypothetical protein